MRKVLIFGAGSIGNHMTYACRCKGWDVTVTDVDPMALQRTKEEIYPSRYGAWDNAVTLTELSFNKNYFDIIIVGTPPDSHLQLSKKIIAHYEPKVLLVEKPLCSPNEAELTKAYELDNINKTKILVGYNHTLTKNTQSAMSLLSTGLIGEPLSIHVNWQEHWGGIFDAHSWLDGPSDSYLGHWNKGGGACGEHSHAIALWSYFSTILGTGPISKVYALMDMEENTTYSYDKSTVIAVESENGLIGSIVQDVITNPPKKYLRVQGTKGFLEWHANFDDDRDALIYGDTKSVHEEYFDKTRPDDFSGEIDHLEELLVSSKVKSPIDLSFGIHVMEVVSAAHKSHVTAAMISL